MLRKTSCVHICIFLVATSVLFAEPATQTDQEQPASAPAGSMEGLSSKLRELGWLRQQPGLMTEAIGTIEHDGKGDSSSIQAHYWATHGKFRRDLTSHSVTTRIVVNNDSGSHRLLNGKVTTLPSHTVRGLNQWVFPWTQLQSISNDYDLVSTSVSSIDGSPSIDYRLTPKAIVAGRRIPFQTPIDLIIANDFSLVRIQYAMLAEGNPYVAFPHVRTFKQMHVVDGVLVPNVEEDYIGHDLIGRLRFASLSISGTSNESLFTPETPEVKR